MDKDIYVVTDPYSECPVYAFTNYDRAMQYIKNIYGDYETPDCLITRVRLYEQE